MSIDKEQEIQRRRKLLAKTLSKSDANDNKVNLNEWFDDHFQADLQDNINKSESVEEKEQRQKRRKELAEALRNSVNEIAQNNRIADNDKINPNYSKVYKRALEVTLREGITVDFEDFFEEKLSSEEKSDIVIEKIILDAFNYWYGFKNYQEYFKAKECDREKIATILRENAVCYTDKGNYSLYSCIEAKVYEMLFQIFSVLRSLIVKCIEDNITSVAEHYHLLIDINIVTNLMWEAESEKAKAQQSIHVPFADDICFALISHADSNGFSSVSDEVLNCSKEVKRYRMGESEVLYWLPDWRLSHAQHMFELYKTTLNTMQVLRVCYHDYINENVFYSFEKTVRKSRIYYEVTMNSNVPIGMT